MEWFFLESILKKLGFVESWVVKIMEIVMPVNYMIARGGENYCPINPTRGLRQGDPLFPYSSCVLWIYLQFYISIKLVD